MRDDGNCEVMQRAMREGRRLAKHERAHVDDCQACMDAWLTTLLEEKPQVAIPEDFAARVAAMAPARQRKKREAAPGRKPWGLAAAIAIVSVLLAVWFSGPAPANSSIGVVFVMLVASEITALALWLGPRWMGR